MQINLPLVISRREHKVDFTVIIIGIFLLETSIFVSALSGAQYQNIKRYLLLRLVHGIFLLLVLLALKSYLKFRKIEYLKYFQLVTLGILTSGLGLIAYRGLADFFEISKIDLTHNLLIALLQGIFWFPVFMIASGDKNQILHYFKSYEERLITSTRISMRESEVYKEIQQSIQLEIRNELIKQAQMLKEEIGNLTSNGNLLESNPRIQKILLGNGLRELSSRLEKSSEEGSRTWVLGQDIHFFSLLIKQFRILYQETAKIDPLKSSTYSLILLVLIAPGFINNFDLRTTIIYLPPLVLAMFITSIIVTKVIASNSKNAFRDSSLLILFLGSLPFLENRIGQAITPNEATNFPLFLIAIFLPLSYYVIMKFLQILKPSAVALIKENEIVASKALEKSISQIIANELAHTYSHRWAIYVHGKILTRLAATGLRLELAYSQSDIAGFNAGLQAILELLDNPDEQFGQITLNLKSETATRLDPWMGLLHIHTEIDQSLELIENSRVSDYGEAIEEIISNSIRHGKAQNITLRVKQHGEKELEITVEDDSTTAPPIHPTRIGLGTRIFNLVSDGRWSISRVGSSTRFHLVMLISE